MKASILQELDGYLLRNPEDAPLAARLRELMARSEADYLSRSNMEGHITSSAFVLTPDRSKALMIHHKAYDRWIQPGGHYEGYGSLQESALREVAEETGVERITALAPYLIDFDIHSIAARPEKNEGPHWHFDFCYLAIASEEQALDPQLAEVHGARWQPLSSFTRSPDSRVSRIALRSAHALGLPLPGNPGA